MLLNNGVSIIVFEITNVKFEQIGEVNKFSSLMWRQKHNGYTSFELNAPVNDENNKYFKRGNIIWCGGTTAGIIEIIKPTTADDGTRKYQIQGRTLEALLTTRIIWGTYYCGTIKKTSTIMRDLVYTQCINPTDTNRKVPYLSLDVDPNVGNDITYQKTGGEVCDALVNMADDASLGFDVEFYPQQNLILFSVKQGKNLVVNNSQGYTPVELSTDTEDILSSSYSLNVQDEKNVALVAGEDSGSNRKKVTSGDNTLVGLDRKELWIDARDIQSTVQNNDGTTTQLTDEEYGKLLVQRGDEKRASYAVSESFDAVIRTLKSQYEYGTDYNKGDTITVVDDTLDISVNTTVTEIEEAIDTSYSLNVTFGFGYPSVFQKVKRVIS